jgi:hypothetical protein
MDIAPANGRIRAFFKWLGAPAAIISAIVGTIAMVTVVYMAFAMRARWAAEDEAKKPLIYLMPNTSASSVAASENSVWLLWSLRANQCGFR